MNQRRRTASPGEDVLPDDDGYAPGTPYDGRPPGDETDLEDEPVDEGHGAPEDVIEALGAMKMISKLMSSKESPG